MALLRGLAGEGGNGSVCEGPAKGSPVRGTGGKMAAVGEGVCVCVFLSRHGSRSRSRPAFPPSPPAAGARGFSGVAEQRWLLLHPAEQRRLRGSTGFWGVAQMFREGPGGLREGPGGSSGGLRWAPVVLVRSASDSVCLPSGGATGGKRLSEDLVSTSCICLFGFLVSFLVNLKIFYLVFPHDLPPPPPPRVSPILLLTSV